jgi:ParB-like chromosome segregation protein Spo0J
MQRKEISHIGQLRPDPRNARLHNSRNIGMIQDALQEVGAARSIVIDEDGVVLAGNGVVEAAGNAGIERVKVVEADGNEIVAVRRSGLTDAQKRRLALFDNRTQDTSEFDADLLAELADSDPDALEGMWTEEELADLLGESGKRFDRTLEEIDLEMLPTKPTWCLMAIPFAKMAEAQPLLDQLEAMGIQVEMSNG